MFSQDLYRRALEFAARAHASQRTPTDLPYVVHLTTVAMELAAALRAEAGRDEDFAIACALLHDVLEDTDTQPENIGDAFGPRVRAGVQALTKDSLLEKPARMPDSLARIARQPPEVAMVKLADRIANLAPPPPSWSREKCETYRDEARAILAALGHASPFLAARLAEKIESYAR